MNETADQTINNQLFEILNNKMFTSEFISGIAGDTSLTKEDTKLYDQLIDETGDDLYVKILFYITHQVFLKEDSKKLNRNIEITVATLDYLTNIKCKIENP